MSTAANPRAPGNHDNSNVASEPTGPIASDSLAAESLKSGGDFADGDAVPLGVSGSNSTLNNTDTSGAVPLPAASSGAERTKQEAQGLGDDERGTAGGVRYPDADSAPADGTTTSGGHYYGAASSSKTTESASAGQATGASDFGASTLSSSADDDTTTTTADTTSDTVTSSASTEGPTAGTGIRPHVPTAPNYTARVSGAINSDDPDNTSHVPQPKGDNLVEGGDVPENFKTFTGNVSGGVNDPGREAVKSFEGINSSVAGSGTGEGMGRDKEGTTEVGGQYGVLESERLN